MKTYIPQKIRFAVAMLLAVLSFSSCVIHVHDDYGYDGLPGDAYVALSWSRDEPEFIEAGTNAIPEIFYWDEFYYIRPGWYVLYYEGEFYNGYDWEFYGWEVEYEIWINEGEPGGYGYDGRNGADNYFTIDLNPRGPYVYSEIGYKSTDSNSEILPERYSLQEESEDLIVVKQVNEKYTMQLTYKKVKETRKK